MSTGHQKHSVVFNDTQFSFASWISQQSEWNKSRVQAMIRIETGNASTSCSLDESNSRALIVALEQHIKNIAQTRNELIAIEQIQKKEATS
jgi:hypothetical protein